jgi:hypothetical protein
MPDYDLQGLSWRSFEHLVQALAVQIVGPNVMPFGDGPDGGREAIFEGATLYRQGHQNWEGYGVIQAKFLQRPASGMTQGEWALRQLRQELRQFRRTGSRRRVPEYYIYATNVILTPAQDAWKDKCLTTLREFAKHFGLKGFDLWDYDKLRVFLDTYGEIRRRFAAWVTTGDVLAEVLSAITTSGPDFEEVMANYLQKELLADQFANLEQAGHATDERIPIARVFVDLPAHEEPLGDSPESRRLREEPQGFINEVLEAARERLDPHSLMGGGQEIMLHDAAGRAGKYVLIGGPGQGKTTLGQYVCQIFRAALLNERPASSLVDEARLCIQTIVDQLGQQALALPNARRFPARVVLNELAAAIASGEATSLLTYIASRIERRVGSLVSADDLRGWLAAYPWVLILDGLDEVPASSNRSDVLSAIRDFWVDAAQINADILVIATSRPQGYNNDFSPRHYAHRWLAPLSAERAMKYAELLVRLRFAADEDRQNKIIERLERASKHDATARLMRSPLQVTIMATLVDQMGQPPQERWNLFREYYNVIYKREVERDIAAATVLRDYRPDIDSIHYYVGLLLQLESENTGKTEARLSAKRFEEIVRARLEDEGHSGEELIQLQADITNAATDRLVFLVGVQENEVGFEIRSLQEFMAAEGLMEGDDDAVRQRLAEIAALPNWRNVLLFAAGKCFSDRQHLRDAILSIAAQLNEDPSDDASRAALAGSKLALDLLEDGPARRQPRFARVFARQALRLLELPPGQIDARLATVYSAGLADIYREELEKRLELDMSSERLGAWACINAIAVSHDLDVGQIVPGASFPTSRTERAQILLAAARSTRQVADGGELLPSMLQIPLRDAIDDELGDVMVASPPPWFNAWKRLTLVDTQPESTYLEIAIHLPGLKRGAFELRTTPIDDPHTGDLSSLAAIENAEESWTVIRAIGEFCADPGKSVLADQLSVLARAPMTHSWWLYRAPWPLAACLNWAHDPSELFSLAKRARQGDLGEIDDWLVAEERWRTDGLREADFLIETDDEIPFSSDIRTVGTPSDMSLWTAASDRPIQKALIKIFQAAPSGRIRAQVADWILTLATLHLRHRGIRPRRYGLSDELIWRLVDDLASQDKRTVLLDFLALVRPTRDDPNVAVLEKVGGMMHRPMAHVAARAGNWKKLLARKVNMEDNDRLLRILAQLCIGGTNAIVDDDILRARQGEDRETAIARVFLRLAQERWQDTDRAEELATEVASVAGLNPDEIQSALTRVRQSDTSPAFGLFLFKLRELVQPMSWRAAENVVGALERSLSQRRSRLDEPMRWKSLGLPMSLLSGES